MRNHSKVLLLSLLLALVHIEGLKIVRRESSTKQSTEKLPYQHCFDGVKSQVNDIEKLKCVAEIDHFYLNSALKNMLNKESKSFCSALVEKHQNRKNPDTKSDLLEVCTSLPELCTMQCIKMKVEELTRKFREFNVDLLVNYLYCSFGPEHKHDAESRKSCHKRLEKNPYAEIHRKKRAKSHYEGQVYEEALRIGLNALLHQSPKQKLAKICPKVIQLEPELASICERLISAYVEEIISAELDSMTDMHVFDIFQKIHQTHKHHTEITEEVFCPIFEQHFLPNHSLITQMCFENHLLDPDMEYFGMTEICHDHCLLAKSYHAENDSYIWVIIFTLVVCFVALALVIVQKILSRDESPFETRSERVRREKVKNLDRITKLYNHVVNSEQSAK